MKLQWQQCSFSMLNFLTPLTSTKWKCWTISIRPCPVEKKMRISFKLINWETFEILEAHSEPSIRAKRCVFFFCMAKYKKFAIVFWVDSEKRFCLMSEMIMEAVTKQLQQNNIHYQNCGKHYTHIIYFYGQNAFSLNYVAFSTCIWSTKRSACLLKFIVDVEKKEIGPKSVKNDARHDGSTFVQVVGPSSGKENEAILKIVNGVRCGTLN